MTTEITAAQLQMLIEAGELKLEMDTENEYYGDTSVKARVTYKGETLLDDSRYVSAPDFWCNCGGAGV